MTVPQPRYAIGDVVYVGRAIGDTETLPCPDCAGSQKWSVTTPAGETFDVPCQRCAVYMPQLRTLKRRTWRPEVEQLTIGSVRIDTADSRDPVSYMCRETGIGTGSVYDERRFHPDHESALRAAEVECEAHRAAYKAEPATRKLDEIASLDVGRALDVSARRQVWDSWWCYHRLREDIERALEDGGDVVGLVRHAIEWEDSEYRPLHPFDVVLRAARALLSCAGAASHWSDEEREGAEHLRAALDKVQDRQPAGVS